MPVDQASSRSAPRPKDGAKLVRYHDFVDQKIESTRRLVKVVDLATAFVALSVGVLLFLFVVTMLEHWLVRGGLATWARWVLFVGLASYVMYFAYRRLWPLCVRPINPIYAAQTIEQGSPALKNSLINLLMFRERRTDISDAVYRTLEEQAAHGLTRVHADSSVDQSHLIKLGYVLIVVVAAAGLYKVFSPKDPLIAAERVLMPWADIVPASRVTISEIKPGVATISRGEYVDVSTEVRGLREEDAVVLRYTTADGDVTGRAVPMKLSGNGLQFRCRLADDADASAAAGLSRSLTYWLEAGDARSLNYAITVVPAASILVERVDYDYPAYTGYVDHSVDGMGDIRAIEGTRVTVHARANGEIRVAHVDFDADGRRDLQMSAAESKGHATFDLELRNDRQTPRHASYVLRFTNDEGRENHNPVKHAIIVDRDLDPEAEIRQPQEKTRDVREDESVAIEIDAADPDFKLSAVRLKGEVAGRAVMSETLLNGEQRGKFTGRFALTPNARGLKTGDVLEYWVEADDNRAPKPNTVVTARKVLRIMSPNPGQQPPPDRVARNERQQPQQGEQGNQQPQNGKQQPENKGGNQGNNGGQQQNGEEQNGKQQNGEGNQGQQSKDQQGQQQDKGGQNQGQGNQAQQGEGGEQKQGDKEKGRQGESQGGASESADGKSGEKQQEGQGGQGAKSGQSGGEKQGQQKSDGEQSGAGASGGESSKDGKRPDGARPDTKQGDQAQGDQQNGQQSNGQRQGGQKDAGKQDGEKSPVSSEGDNDAEAFNRIKKRLEQNGELKKENGDQGASEEKGSQGDKETGRQGDNENRDSKAAAQGERKAGEKSKDGSERPAGANPKEKGEGGAETRGDDVNKRQEPKNGEGQQEKSPGGEQTSSKGAAGDGQEQKLQGSPNSQQGMKPTQKVEQTPSKGEKTNEQEPAAGAKSKKESDSHGDEGGDKAGGGEEGGGQKAPREGTGSAGQNQSADNGAGQSKEKGVGENSSEGGQDAKSDKPTGSSDGKTPGKGSQQQDGKGNEAGRKSGEQQGEGQGDKEQGRQGAGEKGREGEPKDGKQGEHQAGKQGDQKDQQAGKQDKQGDQQEKNAGKSGNERGQDHGNEGGDKNQGQSGGGGGPGGGGIPSQSITGEAPAGDDANLEYARKQTDLVVDKLADQLKQKKIDDKLLKDLGWSEADLKKFVERWQQRKAAAERNDESGELAKRELDDALRSLGLQRGELKQNAAQKDSMRDLREGYHGPVPAEYKERLKAYNQGVSRARQQDE